MTRIPKPGSVWNSSQFSYDSEAVHNTGPETVAGIKTFTDGIITKALTVQGEIGATDLAITGLAGAANATRFVGSTTSGAPLSGTFSTGDFVITQDGHVWVCTVGGSPGTWSPDFDGGGLAGATSATRYVGATASGAPLSGTFVTGDFIVAQNGRFWVCTTGGSPGTWSPNFAGGGLTGATSATRYVGGTTTGAPASGTFAVGDYAIAQDGRVWICTSAGTPGTWVANPKVTTSTLAGGPPGSPADTDIWIATGVDANGTVWHFSYNAGSASTFKWEFIGGSSLVYSTEASSSSQTTLSTWQFLTNAPFIAVPRNGDYFIQGTTNLTTGASGVGTGFVGIDVASGVSPVADVGQNFNSSLEYNLSIGPFRATGLVATNLVRMIHFINSGPVTWGTRARTLSLTPIRIS